MICRSPRKDFEQFLQGREALGLWFVRVAKRSVKATIRETGD